MSGNPLRAPVQKMSDWRQSPAWREASAQLEALAWREILELYGEMSAYRLNEPAALVRAGTSPDAATDSCRFDQAALSALDTLSPREIEVFPYLVAGASNKVIAIELHMSQRTVETHRARIFSKMGVRNAVELVRRATACALIQGPSSRFWQLMGVESSSS